MDLEGFKRNNRGINDGEDFPPELLEQIFNDIQSNPFTITEIEEAIKK